MEYVVIQVKCFNLDLLAYQILNLCSVSKTPTEFYFGLLQK